MMGKVKSAVSSSEESEEESFKRKKHHRHDRFKVEREFSKDDRETEEYTEHVHKVHKHKKHKKKHKRKRSVEIDSYDESASKLKKSASRSQLRKQKNVLPIGPNATITSGSLQGTSTTTSQVETTLSDDVKREAKQNVYGPSLPPDLKKTVDHIFLTPLPPKLKSKLVYRESIDYPEFPPKLVPQIEKPKSTDKDVFGPALPPKLVPSVEKPKLSHKDMFGPALPPKLALPADETGLSEPDDFVGPIPEGSVKSNESAEIQHQLESRASYLKKKLSKKIKKNESDGSKREIWMVELPTEKSASVGLGPRKFKRREGPDMSDRSVWTDTPETKRKKEKEEKTEGKKITKIKSEVVKAKDSAMEEQLARSSSGHKTKSLLEMHQEKQKKKAKKKRKKSPKPVRRPFDRNIDLQVTRMDHAQRETIYKKAQLLNSRFSSGESKFL